MTNLCARIYIHLVSIKLVGNYYFHFMIKSTQLLKGILLVIVISGLPACGANHDAKKITKTYCKCMDSADGLKDKATCLSDATADYTSAISELEADEIEAFTDGYKAGLKSCD